MADEKEKAKAAKVKRPTPLKRDEQNAKRRERNRQFKSQIRTVLRGFDEAQKAGGTADPAKQLNQVYRLMDKGVKKGLLPANRASRLKSRLAARLAG